MNLIFNYIWSNDNMQKGETWTPICIPGVSEEYMLHAYTCFKYHNFGMVLVCTDHSPESCEECHEFREQVFDLLSNDPKNKYWNGAKSATL